jgi:hypothetical protein
MSEGCPLAANFRRARGIAQSVYSTLDLTHIVRRHHIGQVALSGLIWEGGFP